MKTEKDSNIFRNPLFLVLVALISAYLLLPNYLPAATYLCESEKINMLNCLDASWVLSLHLALHKGLVFGKDYIFTYGPLGFISSRTALGFSHRYFLISDFFILGNLTFIVVYAYRKFSNWQALGLCVLTVYTICGVGMYSDQIGFGLLIISLFWLNYFLKYSNVASLIVPILVTSVLFYIKVNMSFVALVLFYLYLFYSVLINKENLLLKVVCGLAVPIIIISLSFPLNTDLFGYIRGSLSIIDGYNDAMSVKANEYFSYLVLAVSLILIFFAVFFIKNYKKVEHRYTLLLFLASVISTFVLFKQSFVRSDLHIAIFFTYFPGICALTVIFYEKISAFKAWVFLGICAVCLTSGLLLGSYGKLSDRLNYYDSVVYPNNIQERYENSFNRFTLPEDVKTIIGSKSVDIIPWNMNYLHFNRLNYDPRPVMQSYTAYTPYLIDLNRQKYESSSAPEFVIFANLSIDGRYAFFDDQAIKISLLKDYKCLGFYNINGSAEPGNNFLLFQREPGHATVNFSELTETSIRLNEDYILPDIDKSYFIKIQANSSLFGSAVRFLYKPFQLSMVFTLDDGTTRQSRVIPPILKSGVLINPLIDEEKDFYDFVQGTPASSTKKIKSFKIILDSPRASVAKIAAKTYSTDIKLSVSELSISRKD